MKILKIGFMALLMSLLSMQSVMALDEGHSSVPKKQVALSVLPNSKVDALLILGTLGLVGFAGVTCLLGAPALVPSLALLAAIAGGGVFAVKKGSDLFSAYQSYSKLKKFKPVGSGG